MLFPFYNKRGRPLVMRTRHRRTPIRTARFSTQENGGQLW